jgi:hypothetical protein
LLDPSLEEGVDEDRQRRPACESCRGLQSPL